MTDTYQGLVCKRGHAGIRYTSNRKCVECCTLYPRKEEDAVCIICGETFQRRASTKKVYCSSSCKDKARNEKYQEQKEARYAERVARRDFARNVKMEKGCELCGYKEHPSALQFDHINPEDKRYTISQCISLSWETMIEEIGKCRVLCANCHSIHTHNQFEGGSFRKGGDKDAFVT